jgi:hypothetical protein
VSTVRSNNESDTVKPKTRIHGHLFVKGNLDYNHSNFCESEELYDLVLFHKNVFNRNTNKPVVFLSCLVEFGCESLLPHYYLPHFKKKFRWFHTIAIGWPGRDFLYKDYVDEFWHIDDKFTNLRHYTKAFSGMSKNIALIENGFKKFGRVFNSKSLNNFFCEGVCKDCKQPFMSMHKKQNCDNCKSFNIINSILSDTSYHKEKYVPLQFDFSKFANLMKKVPQNKKTIGIFARERLAYGRNLPAKFYRRMCRRLEKNGFNIIWLGEKVSTLPCINKRYFDFTKSEYADNVEACMALVSGCAATFQAWTASTRFAQATGTPYCLVESFDQLFGSGQEGKRINLLTKDMNKKKIIIANYKDSMDKLNYFADLCADETQNLAINGDSTDVVGPVHNTQSIRALIENNDLWKLIS